MTTPQALTVITSLGLTDATLTATDVPETDYAAWSSGTTYASAARIIYQHKIFESLQAANLNKTPGVEVLWWVEVSATNRWKCFDLSNSTKTAQATSLYYEITPGVAVNGVAALGLVNATSIRIRLTDPAFGVVYDETISLSTIPEESSWYAWFFGTRSETAQTFVSDLPSYPNATLRVDLYGGASLAISVLLFGQQKTVGIGVSKGAKIGIQDYSRKETNAFGDTVLVQRAYAKRASFQMLIANADLDNTQQTLADLRATPCLWIGSSKYAATQVFGFYSNFDIGITYADYSECSIEIEGLT